eukprot:scaffold16006_cov35-Prasinocladus_malaysianus.AAC.2
MYAKAGDVSADGIDSASEEATASSPLQRRFPANPLLRERAEQQQRDRDVSRQLLQQAGGGTSSSRGGSGAILITPHIRTSH